MVQERLPLTYGYAAGSHRRRGASPGRSFAAVSTRHLGGVFGRRSVSRGAAGVVVRLEYSPGGGGGGDLAARLEGAATLDHHQHYQGIVLVLGPTREVVHRVPMLSHLAGTRLTHNRQGRAIKGVLGSTARGGDH